MYLVGEMKGSMRRTHMNISEYRKVATIVHCRLILHTANSQHDPSAFY